MKPTSILDLVLGKLGGKGQAYQAVKAAALKAPDFETIPPEVDTDTPDDLPVEDGPPTGVPPEEGGPPEDLPPVDAGKPEGVPTGEGGPPDFFNDMGLPTFAVAEGYPSEDDEDEDTDVDAIPPEVDTGKPEDLPAEAGPPTGIPPEDGGPPEDLPPEGTGKPESLPPGEDFFDDETGLPTFLVAEGFPGDGENPFDEDEFDGDVLFG